MDIAQPANNRSRHLPKSIAGRVGVNFKIFALIGYPVGHTLSPYMHNAAFSKLGIKAIYIPFSVEPKNLKKTIETFKIAELSGFNVTIPHKSTCMRYLDRVDKLASMIGAVNTVAIKNKKLIGYNTDATGFVKSLREDLNFNPKGKNCLVIGAGGAGRAIAFALAKAGAKEIIITDVIKNKAAPLAKNIIKYFPGCRVEFVSRISHLASRKIDLLVHATPMGMKPKDPLPIDPKILHKNLAIYDLVYNPSPTKLVRIAKKKRIKATNGLGMLLHQGAQAFELWTGRKAPVGVMRKALIENI